MPIYGVNSSCKCLSIDRPQKNHVHSKVVDSKLFFLSPPSKSANVLLLLDKVAACALTLAVLLYCQVTPTLRPEESLTCLSMERGRTLSTPESFTDEQDNNLNF